MKGHLPLIKNTILQHHKDDIQNLVTAAMKAGLGAGQHHPDQGCLTSKTRGKKPNHDG
jgi:hypothetical protein